MMKRLNLFFFLIPALFLLGLTPISAQTTCLFNDSFAGSASLASFWTALDINDTTAGTGQTIGAALTITSNGSDIQDQSNSDFDSFRYIYQGPISGDSDI